MQGRMAIRPYFSFVGENSLMRDYLIRNNPSSVNSSKNSSFLELCILASSIGVAPRTSIPPDAIYMLQAELRSRVAPSSR